MKGLLSSLSLLTIFPVPEKWSNDIKAATVFFPFAGLILGVIYYFISMISEKAGFSATSMAYLVLGAQIFFTRGFHVDGVADMADGFWGGYDPKRRLEIMKDSFIGVFGVTAVVFLLLGKWVFISQVTEDKITWALVPAAVISRFNIVLTSTVFSYPRSRGTGHDTIKYGSYKNLFISLGYSVPILLYFGPGTLFVFLAMLSLSLVIGLLSYYKIGGVTGDVLGAVSEWTELVSLGLFTGIQAYFPGAYQSIF